LKTRLYSGRGFTLVEILVVITIILVLAGVITPVGKGMMARSRTINCSTNLRQIGTASMLYAAENNMTLPGSVHQRGNSWTLTLQAILQPYSDETLTFKCTEDGNKTRDRTYALNDFLTKKPSGATHLNYSVLAKIDRPESTFMFAEAAVSHTEEHFHFAPYHGGRILPAVFEHQVATAAHGEKSNYLFADGHVETLSRKETQSRLAQNYSRFADPSGGIP
jgi:prepilin-type processing-associated H-X9-DG protein/prepilin-type N-terminal cleavage/methylation domain-containing protein